MNKKIFEHLGGMVSVKLKGKNPEKAINMAMARGIFLWNIKRSSDGVSFRIRNSGFKALQTISRENGFELQKTGQHGLPFFRQVINRRMGFFGGVLFFILALYLLSSFIWFIDVSGTNVVSRDRITAEASLQGVHRGALKSSFSSREVEQELLRQISELSYIRVEVKGIKAHIKVVEKALPSQEINVPCDIIAAREAVVEEVLVLNGQARVKEGDVVAKGDILITGQMDPYSSPYVPEDPQEGGQQPILVRARGIVNARVWYEGYGECPMKSESLIYTGRKARKVYLKTPWGDLPLSGTHAETFPRAELRSAEKDLWTPSGPVGLRILVQQEQLIRREEYSESEAVSIARDKAVKNLEDMLQRAEPFTDCKVEVLSSPSDSILRVKVAVETLEDIGEPRVLVMPQMVKK